MTLIPFVQLEFAGQLGLPEGRYLAREDGGDRVLIVQGFGVPKPPGRLQRRTRAVEPDEEEEEKVSVSRVTIALAERFADQADAQRWLQGTAESSERRAAEVRSATLLLNKALNALRAGAHDPLVQDVGATRALAIRIGYGEGDVIADGRWSEARKISPPRRGRLEDIDPQSRIAAVLARRERVHPAETLLERARLDIEQQRFEEAELGLEAARTALQRYPDGGGEKVAARVGQAEERLHDRREEQG